MTALLGRLSGPIVAHAHRFGLEPDWSAHAGAHAPPCRRWRGPAASWKFHRTPLKCIPQRSLRVQWHHDRVVRSSEPTGKWLIMSSDPPVEELLLFSQSWGFEELEFRPHGFRTDHPRLLWRIRAQVAVCFEVIPRIVRAHGD